MCYQEPGPSKHGERPQPISLVERTRGPEVEDQL